MPSPRLAARRRRRRSAPEHGSWAPARAVIAAAQSMLAMAVVPSLMLTAAWMKRSRKSARCGQDVAMSNSQAASA